MGSDPLGIVSDSIINDWTAGSTILLINMFPAEAFILANLCDSCEEFMSDQIGRTLGWVGLDDADVVTVQMQDQKLIQDDQFYKNLMTQVALEHEVTQKGIIDILAVKSQGVRGSIQKYSRYGKTYLDGLPDTTINTVTIDNSTIDATITAERGFAITVVKTILKVPKENEWVSYRMTQMYGYIASTSVFYYSGDYYHMTGFYYDYTAGDYVVEAYLVNNPTTVVTIHIGNYTPSLGYVTHYVKDGTSEEYYWVYFIGSGNTALDNARSYLTNLDMLPIVELRRNSINVNSDKTSERYKQTSKILEYLGIDVDMMMESLEGNPNASDVRAAYIYFGAEIGSNNPLQAKMVYSTLEYLWLDPSLVSGGQHRIQVNEGDYNTSISWDLQERLTVARSGVNVGTYEGGVGTTTVDNGYLDEDGITWIPVINNKYYGWVRKQETVDEYVEYRIWNVSAATIITYGAFGDIAFKILTPDTLIVMPISQHFLSKFSPIEQGKLFPEILRMVTYSLDIQHLRYYQTPEFAATIQVIALIIAIVVFIFSWGNYGLAVAIYGLIIGMAVGYALNMLLAQIDNPALRAVVAVIAVVVMAYYGNAQGVEQSMLTLTADMVTTAVSTYSEAVMEGIAEQFAEMAVESAMFTTLLTQRQEELDKANEGMQSYMSVEDILKVSQMDVNGYIEGVDLKMYRAVQMQYEWDLVKSMQSQTKIYDYDMHYRLGVV